MLDYETCLKYFFDITSKAHSKANHAKRFIVLHIYLRDIDADSCDHKLYNHAALNPYYD